MTQTQGAPSTAGSGPQVDDLSWVNGFSLPIIVEMVDRAVEQGLSQRDAIAVATKTFVEMIPQFVPSLMGSLHRTKPELLERMARGRDEITRTIDDEWGSALATYEAAAHLAHELNAQVYNAYVEQSDEPSDVTAEVVFVLHGRACTTAGEVLCLMRAGFGDGAAARRRTVHELAVVTKLLIDHPTLNLAQRYIDYSVVEQRDDMKHFQLHAESLGYQPYGETEVEEVEQEYQAILQQYGPDFRRKNQWAAPLYSNSKDIQFAHLEATAGLERWRPFYRESNHHIHAGPLAAAFSVHYTKNGQTIRIGGRADHDLREIWHGTLISLAHCTAQLLDVAVASDNPDNLLAFMCFKELVEDAGVAFARSSMRH